MTKRVMARPEQAGSGSGGPNRLLLALVAIVAVIGLIEVSGILAGNTPRPSSAVESGLAGLPSHATSGMPAPGGTTPAMGGPGDSSGSAAPAASSQPGGSGPLMPVPTGRPTPTPETGGAPSNAGDFDLVGQVVPIGFPLRRDTRYEYRDNFLDVRDGPPDDYNHARVRKDGTLVRLHDGIDIYADAGEPLVAVFDGTVIDARDHWQPWEPSRYGRTIVIVSDEPQSDGYRALYAHADRVWVDPGEHVSRGQILGTLGRTGNAVLQSIHSHLHLELRAPFLLDWSRLGEDRQVDAFNPYPSLKAADPKRT